MSRPKCLQRHLFLHLVLLISLALSAYLFWGSLWVSLLCAVTFFFPYQKMIQSNLTQRQDQHRRRQQLLFFQQIQSACSSGQSLLCAVESACLHLSRLYPSRDAFVIDLRHVYLGIHAHRPLKDLLLELAQQQPNREGQALFRLLAESQRFGPGIHQLLHTSSQLLLILDRIDRHIRSLSARTEGECVLLCLAPILFVAFLQKLMPQEWLKGAYTASALILRILACLLIFLAPLSFLWIRSHPHEQLKKQGPAASLRLALQKSSFLRSLAYKLYQLSPSFLRLRYSRIFRCLLQIEQSALRPQEHDAPSEDQVLCLCATWLLFYLIYACMLALFVLVLSFLNLPFLLLIYGSIPLLILPDRLLTQRKRSYQLELLTELPLFAALLLQLLQCQYSLKQALLFVMDQLRLAPELEALILPYRPVLLSGERASTLLQNLATRIDQADLSALCLLLGQQEEYGGPDLLYQLERQVERGWDILREARLQRGEMLNTRLLLPMFLAFIAVLLCALFPVLGYFQWQA